MIQAEDGAVREAVVGGGDPFCWLIDLGSLFGLMEAVMSIQELSGRINVNMFRFGGGFSFRLCVCSGAVCTVYVHMYIHMYRMYCTTGILMGDRHETPTRRLPR